jgi:hypothetical protein
LNTLHIAERSPAIWSGRRTLLVNIFTSGSFSLPASYSFIGG